MWGHPMQGQVYAVLLSRGADGQPFCALGAIRPPQSWDIARFALYLPPSRRTVPPVNTKLTYLYRDGSNYKQWDEVIVAGSLDREAITRCLWECDFFIPQAVASPAALGVQRPLGGGLSALQDRFAAQGYDFPNEDDHAWHEIESVEPTEDPPTIDVTAAELAQRFKHASTRGRETCLADLIAGQI